MCHARWPHTRRIWLGESRANNIWRPTRATSWCQSRPRCLPGAWNWNGSGEELQRLTKLEELDTLRSGVVGRNTHLLIPDEVAECMRIRGGSHHPSGHWRLDAESGDWECEDPTGYTAGSGYILAAIDGAGAAALAGE